MAVKNIIIGAVITGGLILGHAFLYAASGTSSTLPSGVAGASEASGTLTISAASAKPAASATTPDSAATRSSAAKDASSTSEADNPGWDNGAGPRPVPGMVSGGGPGVGPGQGGGPGQGVRRDGFRKQRPDRPPEGQPDRDRQPGLNSDSGPQDRFAPGHDDGPNPGFGPKMDFPRHHGPDFAGPGEPEGPEGDQAFPDRQMHRDNFGKGMGRPPRGPFPDWNELEKCDPEMFNLLKEDAQGEIQTRTLTMQYRQAQGDSKTNIGKQLEEAVKSHFVVRQKRRALELSRLEDELKRMKEMFEKRNQSQDKIIEQRVKMLKGDEENLF